MRQQHLDRIQKVIVVMGEVEDRLDREPDSLYLTTDAIRIISAEVGELANSMRLLFLGAKAEDAERIADLLAALEHLVIEAPKQAVKGSVDAMTFNAAMNEARAAVAKANGGA